MDQLGSCVQHILRRPQLEPVNLGVSRTVSNQNTSRFWQAISTQVGSVKQSQTKTDLIVTISHELCLEAHEDRTHLKFDLDVASGNAVLGKVKAWSSVR